MTKLMIVGMMLFLSLVIGCAGHQKVWTKGDFTDEE
jgi:hypothetical protein